VPAANDPKPPEGSPDGGRWKGDERTLTPPRCLEAAPRMGHLDRASASARRAVVLYPLHQCGHSILGPALYLHGDPRFQAMPVRMKT
jgi:hypothetical protein